MSTTKLAGSMPSGWTCWTTDKEKSIVLATFPLRNCKDPVPYQSESRIQIRIKRVCRSAILYGKISTKYFNFNLYLGVSSLQRALEKE
jgi:hypothetical protein